MRQQVPAALLHLLWLQGPALPWVGSTARTGSVQSFGGGGSSWRNNNCGPWPSNTPRRIGSLQNLRGRRWGPLWLARGGGDVPPQREAQLSLLLVDDEEHLLEAVRKYLAQHTDLEVRTATSAAGALREIKRQAPDVLVSDLNMPGVDGFQLLLQVRSYPELRTLPVVLLTARARTQDRILGYQAGCDAYLTKPFDPEELVAMVRSLVARRDEWRAQVDALGRELAERDAELTDLRTQARDRWIADRGLTTREVGLLRMILSGMTHAEMAEELGVASRTIDRWVAALVEKSGEENRTKLAERAQYLGLFGDPGAGNPLTVDRPPSAAATDSSTSPEASDGTSGSWLGDGYPRQQLEQSGTSDEKGRQGAPAAPEGRPHRAIGPVPPAAGSAQPSPGRRRRGRSRARFSETDADVEAAPPP